MINKSIKKVWLICLCLASLSLAGCFHIPDKDWLPSKNKVDTWDIKTHNEVDEAFDAFVQWIDIISSQRKGIKSEENDNNIEDWNIISTENLEESPIQEDQIDEENS